jgi:hypothetical protein
MCPAYVQSINLKYDDEYRSLQTEIFVYKYVCDSSNLTKNKPINVKVRGVSKKFGE